jgi:uncharacterized membrane-anchored protein YhcB (DUF1043 family)
VIAMLYTYYSGRDTTNTFNKIQETITKVDDQVERISNETKKNAEVLIKMMDGIQDVHNAIATSANALHTLDKEELTEADKNSVIENIQNTNSSMLMFLNRMNRTN